MISKKSLSWPGFESWSQLFTAKKHGGLHSNYGGLHSNYGGQSPQPSQMTVDTVISVTPLFWRSDGTDHPPYRNYGAKSLWRWHCTALNIYCTVIAKPWLQCNHCNYDPQIQGSCDWMRCGHSWVTEWWSSLFLTSHDAISLQSQAAELRHVWLDEMCPLLSEWWSLLLLTSHNAISLQSQATDSRHVWLDVWRDQEGGAGVWAFLDAPFWPGASRKVKRKKSYAGRCVCWKYK
jgi:hypothetical protein